MPECLLDFDLGGFVDEGFLPQRQEWVLAMATRCCVLVRLLLHPSGAGQELCGFALTCHLPCHRLWRYLKVAGSCGSLEGSLLLLMESSFTTTRISGFCIWPPGPGSKSGKVLHDKQTSGPGSCVCQHAWFTVMRLDPVEFQDMRSMNCRAPRDQLQW